MSNGERIADRRKPIPCTFISNNRKKMEAKKKEIEANKKKALQKKGKKGEEKKGGLFGFGKK